MAASETGTLMSWSFDLYNAYFNQKQTEAVARRCSVKKVFEKISPNSLENLCARVSFLIKSQA